MDSTKKSQKNKKEREEDAKGIQEITHRFYENKFPVKDDLVMVNINKLYHLYKVSNYVLFWRWSTRWITRIQ